MPELAVDEAKRRPLVLVVDDEADVLETTSALLEDDFDVIRASSGSEAMRLLAKADVDVICTDYNMPGMNGIELLRQAVAGRRHLSGILVSGFREFADKAEKSERDRFWLLVKPYAPTALLDLVVRALKYSAIKRDLQKNGGLRGAF